MKLLFPLTLHLLFAPLAFAEDFKLSDRADDGNLQRICSASRDGYTIFKAIFDEGTPPDLTFVRLTNAKQVRPSFLPEDPQYNTNPPRRPIQTSANLTILRQINSVAEVKAPDSIEWNESVLDTGWRAPSHTAYQRLTEAFYDPFAHNGELAFRFDESKKDRNQFADLLIVPDGWGSQIDSAAVWRLDNKGLFERAALTKNELAFVRSETRSTSSLIKNMAFTLLMKHSVLSAEDLKTWLRSQPSLIDVAVTVQLVLTQDPKPFVDAAPTWMVPEGEHVWGGALIAATLLFTTNQAAVDSMQKWHYKRRQVNETEASELMPLLRVAETQPGFYMIKDIGSELVRVKQLRNYPFLSAGHLIFSSSSVVDPSLLSTD